MSTYLEHPAGRTGLPALDCHAHVAPDVTTDQLRTLGDAVIFAVTRSLAEAEMVSRRRDPQLLWGCGVHPGVRAALDSFDHERFERLAEQLVLIGEVGMDAHAGRRDRQQQVLTQILASVALRPMLVSVHSSGWPDQVVDLLAARPPRGPILHWFTGAAATIRHAAEIGCFFSVYNAMADVQLAALPVGRVLPETDFPAARRRGSPARPGDVGQLERRLAQVWGTDPGTVRVRLWRNLRQLVLQAGALDRLPDAIADHLIAV
jgi:TatD DNase family protein